METEYQIPMDTSGRVHARKLIHDLAAAINGLEMCYQGILKRPEMKGDYEYMLQVGKKRLEVIMGAIAVQIEMKQGRDNK